jgi:hypothetical protein
MTPYERMQSDADAYSQNLDVAAQRHAQQQQPYLERLRDSYVEAEQPQAEVRRQDTTRVGSMAVAQRGLRGGSVDQSIKAGAENEYQSSLGVAKLRGQQAMTEAQAQDARDVAAWQNFMRQNQGAYLDRQAGLMTQQAQLEGQLAKLRAGTAMDAETARRKYEAAKGQMYGGMIQEGAKGVGSLAAQYAGSQGGAKA